MTAIQTEPHGMAKRQRTIQVPEELIKLADHLEALTGVRFNRQILAGMLQYFFSRPDGPDPIWMELAVAIERGELSVGDLPRERMSVLAAQALSIKQNYPESDEHAQEQGALLAKAWTQFDRMSKRKETDPVDRVTAHWSEVTRSK